MCNMCERCDDELVSVHKLANIIVEILFSVFSCAIYSAARAMDIKGRTERVNALHIYMRCKGCALTSVRVGESKLIKQR